MNFYRDSQTCVESEIVDTNSQWQIAQTEMLSLNDFGTWQHFTVLNFKLNNTNIFMKTATIILLV